MLRAPARGRRKGARKATRRASGFAVPAAAYRSRVLSRAACGVCAGAWRGLVALLLLAAAACCSAQTPSPPPPSPPPPNSGLLAASLIAWGQSLTAGGTQLASWTGASACSGLTTSSWLGVTCAGSAPTMVVLSNQALSGNISCAVATVTTLTRIDLVRAHACAQPVMHVCSRS
jgi:hypothetical protein